MKNKLLFGLMMSTAALCAQQPNTQKWILNQNGLTASYWENANGNPNSPSFVFHTTTDSANVQQVCYSADTIYVRTTGMTTNMGKYLNPGGVSAQTFVYRIPRNPSVPSSKTAAPANFAVGALLNGIPVYGRAAGTSWNGSAIVNGGPQIWNTEVYLSEGFVLDTAFGAHPQQQGQYHSHAKPYRLYEASASSVHSPIVGFAFDGYPIYGPYGYSAPTNSLSSVTRMKSGYSIRNITVRQTLPDGTVLSSGQYGPAVSSTYPLVKFCEDYEWLSSNNGDLDEYNGRFCVTPEYPAGTYAYFVTLDATGTPVYPYYIGSKYYGAPYTNNFNGGCLSAKIPSSGLTCLNAITTGIQDAGHDNKLHIYPSPASGFLTVEVPAGMLAEGCTIYIYNSMGQKVFETSMESSSVTCLLPQDMSAGIYSLHMLNRNRQVVGVQKVVISR